MGAGQRTDRTGLRPWVRAALRCGAVLAAAALALPTATAAYAAPEPTPSVTVSTGDDPLAAAKTTLGPLLDRLHQLYQDAEAATEQYNGAVAKQTAAQQTVDDLHRRVAAQQAAVDAGVDIAAQLAAAQYRNGRASDLADLMLAEDPYQAIAIARLLDAAGRSQKAFLDRLKSDRESLTQLQTQAEQALAQTTQLAAQQEQAKTEMAKRLAAVEDMVGSLTGAQRSELEALEQQEADEAQLAFLASGALGKGERTPSAAGRKAVAFALGQLGKDYVWGGDGPDVFDCSGLTSQAWLHAGVPIPRTSQEQWAQLKHVPLNQLRPGDLVIYHVGATHVAMYIGGGLIVQAPHTGDVVKVSKIGAMAILGAVRPDPDADGDDKGGQWKVPDVKASPTRIAPSKSGTLPPAAPTPPSAGGPPAPTPGSGKPSTPGQPTGSGSGTPSGSGSPSGSATPSAGASGPSGSASASVSRSASGTASKAGTASPTASE